MSWANHSNRSGLPVSMVKTSLLSGLIEDLKKRTPQAAGSKVGDRGEIARQNDSLVSPIPLASVILNGSLSLSVTPIFIPSELFVAAYLT